jgi:hypothetical protein
MRALFVRPSNRPGGRDHGHERDRAVRQPVRVRRSDRGPQRAAQAGLALPRGLLRGAAGREPQIRELSYAAEAAVERGISTKFDTFIYLADKLDKAVAAIESWHERAHLMSVIVGENDIDALQRAVLVM